MDSRLRALAYSMLGSLDDADDVLQEARLRLMKRDTPPDNEEAFLYRVVSNLCVDKLRKNRRRRETYFGPWLPEPASEERDQVELAEQLTMGFVHMLENLAPAERIAYVLREAFDFSHEEVAAVLDVSAANARQRFSRARKKLKDLPQPGSLPKDEAKAALEQMVGFVMAGNVDGLIELLAQDVVAYTDGGGVVSAAIRPVHGRERIVQVTMHLVQKAMAVGGIEMSFQELNGTWALVVTQHGVIHSVTFVDGSSDGIDRLYVLRNPDKLSRMRIG